MHGVILLELNRFVDSEFGSTFWKEAVGRAGLTHTLFLPTQLYSDSEFQSIVAAICEKSGRDPGSILEAFGEYIVPALATLYAALIEGDWTLLDLLEHTEATIHRVVRIRAAGALPPRLTCKRLHPNEVEIEYASQRRLCAFARGIIRGLAKLYEEKVVVTEPTCMLRGDAACRILVKRAPVS